MYQIQKISKGIENISWKGEDWTVIEFSLHNKRLKLFKEKTFDGFNVCVFF